MMNAAITPTQEPAGQFPAKPELPPSQPVEEKLQKLLDKALYANGSPSAQKIRNFLNGTWLGEPLHVVLTDVPIGAWTMTELLDLVSASKGDDAGLDAASDIALGAGIVAAVGASVARPVVDRARRGDAGTLEDGGVLGVRNQQVPHPAPEGTAVLHGGAVAPDVERLGLREALVIVLGIHHPGDAHLLQVGKARGGAGLVSRLGEDGEQDRSQDGYDRNHHEQFDESKTPTLPTHDHNESSFRNRASYLGG